MSERSTEQSIGVVGGGIVGLAVARELTRRRPGVRVVVLEKEDRLAQHQTGHNSGVVHAGIYYRPGSLKAELCTRGRSLLREYCAERAIPYEECGKLVVAVARDELGRLDALERTATDNGVPGLRRVEGAAITEIEPHAAGLVALHSPQTAITDYVAIARRRTPTTCVPPAGRCAPAPRSPGSGVRRAASRWPPTQGPLRVDRLVVCAGLYADRVSQWPTAATGRGSCRSAGST